jgi:hypothetical protein
MPYGLNPDPAGWAGDEDLDADFPLGDGTAETEASVLCPYCGETVEIGIDPGSGPRQEYVEDCRCAAGRGTSPSPTPKTDRPRSPSTPATTCDGRGGARIGTPPLLLPISRSFSNGRDAVHLPKRGSGSSGPAGPCSTLAENTLVRCFPAVIRHPEAGHADTVAAKMTAGRRIRVQRARGDGISPLRRRGSFGLPPFRARRGSGVAGLSSG